ncbi:MAG: acyloxyacyl hydrolase [Marinicaulis sp.]|nr:acyloxyacyl hydrolase [Marinicaulis sp.]
MRARPIVITMTMLVASVFNAAPAYAGNIDEARVGVLSQGFGGWSPNIEDGASINLELLFQSPEFMRVIGAPRPVIGASIATDSDATSQIYAGFEWRTYLTRGLFVAGMVGGAVHNGETAAFDPVADAARVNDTLFFGCRVLVRLGTDIGYDLTERVSASFHWEHISNAGVCDENEGLDNMGLRIGYRF